MRNRSIRLLVATGALVVALPAVAHADTNAIVPVAPKPQEHVTSGLPAIEADVSGTAPRAGAVHLLVDGKDVSDALAIAGSRVTYQPATPLADGIHAVELDVDEGANSRLSYQWSFAVDGTAAKASQSSVADAAPAAGVADQGPEVPSYPPLNAALGDSGPPFGYPNFGLYALNQSPFYWGQNVPFVFNGAGGGNGFLTVGGIPGFFNLTPIGYNSYYVVVPIPVGYAVTNPPIVCHFFRPNGSPVVVTYRRHVAIVARRDPATTRRVAQVALRRVPQVRAAAVQRAPLRAGYFVPRRTLPRPAEFAPAFSRPIAPSAMRPAIVGNGALRH